MFKWFLIRRNGELRFCGLLSGDGAAQTSMPSAVSTVRSRTMKFVGVQPPAVHASAKRRRRALFPYLATLTTPPSFASDSAA